MAQCDPHELMEVSACYGCLDTRQAMIATLAVLCEINQTFNPMATCDVNELMSKASCFGCLQGNQPVMVMLQLLCEILQSGGGGTCNVCLEGSDPVDAPSCDCAHATRLDTGEMWYWRPLTAQWIKYISNT